MSLLNAYSISKSYNDKSIFEKINFNMDFGDKLLLFGPNGAGKTTFLKSLSGTIPIDSGKIQINHKQLNLQDKKLRDQIVYIRSREQGLYPQLTIEENINLFRKALGLTSLITEDKISSWEKVDAFRLALKTKFSKCSKGMKQISLIFIQTLQNPQIILLDEPFSGLDEENKNQVFEVINKQFLKQAVLIASHDKNSPFSSSYKHIYLKDGKLAN